VLQQSLRNGASKSCGCFYLECVKENAVTHGAQRGGKKTPEYRSWDAMLQRVRHQDQEKPSYARYRGCTVDARWDPQQGGTFANFLEDMGPRPGAAYSLDKDIIKPGNRHYGPGLCCWATPRQQSRHTRQNRNLTFNGKTQCLMDWAQEIGISYAGLRNRITRGWSLERALTTPAAARA